MDDRQSLAETACRDLSRFLPNFIHRTQRPAHEKVPATNRKRDDQRQPQSQGQQEEPTQSGYKALQLQLRTGCRRWPDKAVHEEALRARRTSPLRARTLASQAAWKEAREQDRMFHLLAGRRQIFVYHRLA